MPGQAPPLPVTATATTIPAAAASAVPPWWAYRARTVITQAASNWAASALIRAVGTSGARLPRTTAATGDPASAS